MASVVSTNQQCELCRGRGRRRRIRFYQTGPGMTGYYDVDHDNPTKPCAACDGTGGVKRG